MSTTETPRVLVIDPDASTARAVKEALDGVGVVVDAVASLEEGTAALTRFEVDVVVVAVSVPPRALLKALVCESETSAALLVVGDDDAAPASWGLAAEGRYLRKPLEVAHLRNVLVNTLAGSAALKEMKAFVRGEG